MENGDKRRKSSLKYLLFLILFGLLIIIFKYYLIRSDLCHETCSNINSELDIIKCLDSCSINSEDYREPISYFKILLYSSIVLIFFTFIYRFIKKNNGGNNNIIIQLFQRIKRFKDNLRNHEKKEKNGYKKIE